MDILYNEKQHKMCACRLIVPNPLYKWEPSEHDLGLAKKEPVVQQKINELLESAKKETIDYTTSGWGIYWFNRIVNSDEKYWPQFINTEKTNRSIRWDFDDIEEILEYFIQNAKFNAYRTLDEMDEEEVDMHLITHSEFVKCLEEGKIEYLIVNVDPNNFDAELEKLKAKIRNEWKEAEI